MVHGSGCHWSSHGYKIPLQHMTPRERNFGRWKQIEKAMEPDNRSTPCRRKIQDKGRGGGRSYTCRLLRIFPKVRNERGTERKGRREKKREEGKRRKKKTSGKITSMTGKKLPSRRRCIMPPSPNLVDKLHYISLLVQPPPSFTAAGCVADAGRDRCAVWHS